MGVGEVLDLNVNLGRTLHSEHRRVKDRLILIFKLAIFELLGEVEGFDRFGGAEDDGGLLGRGALVRGEVSK